MDKVDILRRFVKALNSHDLDAIMAFFCDSCIFFGSAGPAPNGVAFRGREEVRKGFEDILARFHDAVWTEDNHFVSGTRGYSEWTFKGTDREGNRTSVRGCDAFVFQGDLIQIKDSFRKQI